MATDAAAGFQVFLLRLYRIGTVVRDGVDLPRSLEFQELFVEGDQLLVAALPGTLGGEGKAYAEQNERQFPCL